MTDDDARHPDEPTEPPDDAESARVRDGEEWVEVDPGGGKTDVERDGSVAHEDADADIDREVGEWRRDAQVEGENGGTRRDVSTEARVSRDVQVKPGGEVDAERNGSAAHEDVDAMVDDEVEGMRRDAQVDRESAGTHRDVERVRGSASAHMRSTTTVEENDQPLLPGVNDVPNIPPEPPGVTA